MYGWCIEHIDPAKREEWDMMLNSPLPGEKPKANDMVAEAEGAAFMALMGQVNGS